VPIERTASASLDPNQRSMRIAWLDGIRGIAITLVVASHYIADLVRSAPGSFTAYVVKFLSMTWCGVDLFFVLSGFLIGGILIDHHRRPGFLSTFYLRRTCRILPVYFLLLIAYLVAASIQWPENPVYASLLADPMPIWSYFLFVQNIPMALESSYGTIWLSVTWSLAIEEQFYLAVPFLFLLLGADRLRRWLPLAIVAVIALRITVFKLNGGNSFPCYVLMPCRADALLLGVIAAFATRTTPVVAWAQQRMTWIYWLLAGLLLILLSMALRKVHYLSFEMISYGYTTIALFFALVVFTLSIGGAGRLKQRLEWTVLCWLGRISYGVYLFHQAVNNSLHAIFFKQEPVLATAADAGLTTVSVVVTLALASVSWAFFERRMVRLGQQRRY
jgi:peptidoglycan/LPS O-acetylase OafA/YrhL